MRICYLTYLKISNLLKEGDWERDKHVQWGLEEREFKSNVGEGKVGLSGSQRERKERREDKRK